MRAAAHMKRECLLCILSLCLCWFPARAASPESTILRIQAHIQEGNLDAAEQAIAAALKNTPNDGGIYNLRGIVHADRNELKAAEADFNRAIQLAPDMAWAYQGRGTTMMHLGKMLQAIDDFNRALELDSTIPWAYFNRGLANVFIGKEDEAQKDFAESLRLRPELKGEMDRRIDLARHLRRIGNLK